MFFLSKPAIKSHNVKMAICINDIVILVTDTTVMMGSLQEFFDGRLPELGPFNDLIVTAAFDYKRRCLIVALNDSSIWHLYADSKQLVDRMHGSNLICIDHDSRAIVIASMHGLISWSNWDHSKCNRKDFKETGILLVATCVHSIEYNLIYWAAGIIRKEQLWIVIYRLDVFDENVELIGRKSLGSHHPLHFVSLENIPGVLALITDSNQLFLISDLSTGIKWKKVEIPVSDGSIISDFIMVPSNEQKLQSGYISTDSGQLFKVTIDGSNSRFKVEFRQLNQVKPIFMMVYLLTIDNCDVLAFFGDLCDGSIVQVGIKNVTMLKRLENSSPALDSVLLSDKTSSRLILSCGSRKGRLIEYTYGIPAVVLASSTGFSGVTGIWSLKQSESDAHHSLLLISFIEQTRILCFKGINVINV
jgi:hypothetical protein